jgi:uncharacterized repeat protein (TIGR03803 family)
VQAANGNFYGTTSGGGASNACFGGCGTVFEITAGGKLTVLHSFDGTDGSDPGSLLVQATNGNFYGTTYQGGASANCLGGCGTVFEITPAGRLTTLHSFDFTDGEYPNGLVQPTNGTFYGTGSGGGTSSNCGSFGCGTVFSLSVGLGPFVETLPTARKGRGSRDSGDESDRLDLRNVQRHGGGLQSGFEFSDHDQGTSRRHQRQSPGDHAARNASSNVPFRVIP